MSNVNVNRAIAMALAGNYKIGGDGEMMVQDVLWSGLKTDTGAITLSKSILNYDFLIIGAWGFVNSSRVGSQAVYTIIPKSDYDIGTATGAFVITAHMPTATDGTQTRRIIFGLPTTDPERKTLQIGTINTSGLREVIGVKFTGTNHNSLNTPAIYILHNTQQTITVNSPTAESINTLLKGYQELCNTNNEIFETTENGIIIKKHGFYQVSGNFSTYVSSSHFLMGGIYRYRENTKTSIAGFAFDHSQTLSTSASGIVELQKNDEIRLYFGGGYGSFTYTVNYNRTELPTTISAILLKEIN